MCKIFVISLLILFCVCRYVTFKTWILKLLYDSLPLMLLNWFGDCCLFCCPVIAYLHEIISVLHGKLTVLPLFSLFLALPILSIMHIFNCNICYNVFIILPYEFLYIFLGPYQELELNPILKLAWIPSYLPENVSFTLDIYYEVNIIPRSFS